MDAPRLSSYGPFDSLHAFKSGFLDYPLELVEKEKKCPTENDQVNREVVSWPGTVGCSERCEQVYCRSGAAAICDAIILVFPRALGRFAKWSKRLI